MISTELSRKHRYFLLATTIVPPLGVLAAIVLLWNRFVGWSDMVVLVTMYILCGLGISAGFHRLFSHHSYRPVRPIKIALAAFGTMAAHGPPLLWVAHHRRHHAHADHEGDPHSPHLNPGEGAFDVARRLWFAHSGWRFTSSAEVNPAKYAREILRDNDLRWISRHFVPVTLAGIPLAGLLGFALTGSLKGTATAMLWGGPVRIFLGHHVTYTVNSIGHYFGPRRFATDDESRNVFWLALPTFGDSWHNNHHAFPNSAHHGLRRHEIDPSGLLIDLLERLRLVRNVVRVPPERQRERELTLPADADLAAGDERPPRRFARDDAGDTTTGVPLAAPSAPSKRGTDRAAREKAEA